MKNSTVPIIAAAALPPIASSSDEGLCELLTQCREHRFQRFSEIDRDVIVAQLSEISEEELSQFSSRQKHLERQDRVTQLGCFAAAKALSRCTGLSRGLRTSVVVGTSRGPTATLEQSFEKFLHTGRVPALTSPTTTLGTLGSSVVQVLGLTGEASAISATCTSGLGALASASSSVRNGDAELAIAVGSEAPLTPFTMAQMKALGVLADNPALQFPCKPLAEELRETGEGIVLGEGAAALILASHELLQGNSSAAPIALLSAIHSEVEAISSPTGVSPDGSGFQRAMSNCLEKTGISRPDLIIAHAPGTRNGDAAERKAISTVFGATPPPLYSPKWLFGHTFGASGSLSLVLALELLQGASLPPLPYGSSVNAHLPLSGDRLNHIMINTAGFGGITSSAIVSRPSGKGNQ